MKRILVLVLLSITFCAQADFPVHGDDPVKLEADFAGVEILDGLSFASANCRVDYFACGSWSEFLLLDRTGITDDGRIATLWIGRWFSEPMSIRVGQRVWSDVVYFQFWTGEPPYTDYTGASMVVQGVNFWSFIDQVLNTAGENKNGKYTLAAPGWHGVHLSDFAVTAQTAAPADIIVTASVIKVPDATHGKIEINFSIDTH